jgi:hypothetical protein
MVTLLPAGPDLGETTRLIEKCERVEGGVGAASVAVAVLMRERVAVGAICVAIALL